MSTNDWKSLIARHLDGDASQDELATLSEQLESDPELRLLYLKMARVHATLASGGIAEFHAIEADSVQSVPSATAPVEPGRVTSRRWFLPIAAAAVIAITAALIFLLKEENPSAITITSLEGSVEWMTADGQERHSLETGRSLLGGEITTLSPDAWVAFAYPDGTRSTVYGLSALRFPESDQKILHLTRGRLTANVSKQPADRPLLVQTPAAKLEVIGTQFDVVADDETTSLTVGEGEVEMIPENGKASFAVSGGEQAMATLEDRGDIHVVDIKLPTHAWRANLSEDTEHGIWISWQDASRRLNEELIRRGVDAGEARRKLGDRFRDSQEGDIYAAELKIGTDPNRHTMAISVGVQRAMTPPVILAERSEFRVRGTHPSGKITFGCIAIDTTRGTSGRYTLERDIEENSFEFEVKLEEFRSSDGVSPVGRELVNCFVMTNSSDPGLGMFGGLAISAIELLEP